MPIFMLFDGRRLAWATAWIVGLYVLTITLGEIAAPPDTVLELDTWYPITLTLVFGGAFLGPPYVRGICAFMACKKIFSMSILAVMAGDALAALVGGHFWTDLLLGHSLIVGLVIAFLVTWFKVRPKKVKPAPQSQATDPALAVRVAKIIRAE